MNISPKVATAAAQARPTLDLVRFVCGLDAKAVPEVALHAVRRHTLDTIGAIVAGSTQDVTRYAYQALAPFAGKAAENGRRLGLPGVSGSDLDLLTSAYLAGTAAHGLEVDDGFRPGMIHPGSVVVTTALLLGAQEGASGRDTLIAILAGYEVACRLAALCHPRARWRGFHPTSAVGVFAAAATAGKLFGFDERQMQSAFGVAASKASGLFSFLNGGDVKRLHSGHAAREGIISALLVREGLIGPADVLEYKNGFLNAFAGGDVGQMDYSTADVLSAGGSSGASPFAITDCYIKPYACCRHIHPPIDAALKILADLGNPGIEQIESIDIATYAVAAAHAEPTWTEMTTAQMSMGFSLATAIRFGEVGIRHFDEAHRADEATIGLCRKVSTRIDAELEANYPAKRSARVTIRLGDGRSGVELVTDPRGGAKNPLSDAELERKFKLLTSDILGARADAVVEMVRDSASLGDVGELMTLLLR